MDFTKLNTDLKDLRRRNRLLGMIVGGLTVSQMISLFLVASIAGTDRVVVVPPNINKTFWVTKDQASREYLEEMASFVGWLILDASPSTVDWKKTQLLSYVSPDQHGAMSTQLNLAAERLKRDNASTSFVPQYLSTNEKDQTVTLMGRLRTQINGQDTHEPETKAYLAEFQYAGGRIHLKTFKEVPYGQNVKQGSGPAVDVSVHAK